MRKLVFSTEHLPAGLDDRRRYQAWRDLYEATFGSLDLPRIEGVPFSAHLNAVQYDGVGVAQFSTTLARMRRTREHLARDARNHFGLALLGRRSGMQHTQFGREIVHQAGTTALGAGGELIDFQMPAGVEWTIFNVPREVLRERVKNAEDLVARPLNPPPEVVAHLRRYAEMVLNAPPAHPVLAGHVSQTVLDLVALTLGCSGDSVELARQRGLRAARLQGVLHEIEANFARSGFSPQHLAVKLGLSPRYVQELLQEAGSSFTARVLALRLQKARAMLTDGTARSVAEVAFDCGFSDISYFNRCFRRRFGDTPTGMRGQAQREH
jgi:AraC-like DNA-binding protein